MNKSVKARSVRVPFANKTTVTPKESRAQIETLLERHGASSFAFLSQPDRGVLMFELGGRRVRVIVPMPVDGGPNSQIVRTRWRALLLVVKAKLEAVSAGVSMFEDEFLAHIVMNDGSTVGEWARPQIAAMYEHGAMPPMLPGAT